MKYILFLSALLIVSVAAAQQVISMQEYEQMKSNGQLNENLQYQVVNPQQQQRIPNNTTVRYSGPVQAQSTTCNCLVPLDSTFNVVPFRGAIPPDYRTDDQSTDSIIIPFSFNFFGTLYNKLYINNNGNISFDFPYSSFNSLSFPSNQVRMMAPFWTDVDTRDSLSGIVYYKITPTYIIVKWENVGYYYRNSDKLNAFQLIITDGFDTIVPAGSNASYCYGDMQWTTGDGSNGVNGFGGFPSTTGVNEGNGTDYFQVTRSDAPGLAFDGQYGLNDGVDFLDDLEIYFNTSLPGNVPPLVLNNSICDTIDIYTGDTLRSINQDSVMFDFYFMTPEINQTVTATLSSNAPAGAFSYVQTINTSNYKRYSCTFRAKDIPPGIYTVTGSSIDDGIPVGQNSGEVIIRTYFDGNLSNGVNEQLYDSKISIYPNPADDALTIENIPASTSSIIITDILGQVAYTACANGNQMQVNTAVFAPGVYFITLISANGERESIKFIRR